ncbi:MAG: hypothetical protein GC189_09425 [Alphaproteobacteria bacterium]|nr:hypothetical protein [Alphaproteobacteria bacterium]
MRTAALAAALCVAPGAALAQRGEATEMSFEALARQPLYPGECGMFLWSRAERPQFVFVALDEPAEAKVRVDSRNRTLRRSDFSGAPVYGHFERQTFSGDRITITADVEFDLDRPLRDGAVVKSGVLRARDDRGWETVLPVGGLVACKAQE